MLLKLNLQRYAAVIYAITMNYDSNVTSVDDNDGTVFTTSGETKIVFNVNTTYTFTVGMTQGYELDSVTSDEGNISNVSGNSFQFISSYDMTANITITTKKATSQVSIDLTTLSGWGNVTSGSHNIQVVAKADGYRDSEKSTAVSFTKGSSFTQVLVTRTSANRSQISVSKDKIYSVQTKNMPFGSSQEGIFYFKYENGWTSTAQTYGQVDIVSSTDTSIIFTGYSGSPTSDTWFNGWGDVIVLEGNKEAIESDFNGFTSENNMASWSCIIEDTLITLANGETKKVQDITYDDELLVWNFYDGKFDKAKPCWVTKPQIAHEYNLCKFSNGVEIGFVGQGGDIGYHRIYNDELKSFTHTGVKETPIGTHTFAQDGSKPTLIEQHIVKKQVRYYNVGTEKHINIFTNGILTSSRISNKYAIKDMKYIGERLISEQEEQEYINKKLERC